MKRKNQKREIKPDYPRLKTMELHYYQLKLLQSHLYNRLCLTLRENVNHLVAQHFARRLYRLMMNSMDLYKVI